jgi:hypothetical protein
VWKRYSSSGGVEPSIRAIGPSDLHVISCIGDSRVEAPKLIATRIAISRSAISRQDQNRPSVGTRVRRSKGVGVRRIGVFEGKKLLQLGIAKRDIPTEGLCGPQQELVEDRWHHIGDREKESPESIDIRIRDPANPEIPIEVTGSGKVEPHVCIGVSSRRISGVGKSKCLISRVAISR